eukprot:jgi/Astpho2/3537/fgenesh1_pg.00057_%23_21_t
MTAAYLCQRDMLLLWAGAARRGLQVSGVRQPEVLRCTQDVRALHRCARLQTLKLEGNKLSRLEGLEGLLGLRCLQLARNAVRNRLELRTLAALPQLQDLTLAGNPVVAGMPERQRRILLWHMLPGLVICDGAVAPPTVQILHSTRSPLVPTYSLTANIMLQALPSGPTSAPCSRPASPARAYQTSAQDHAGQQGAQQQQQRPAWARRPPEQEPCRPAVQQAAQLQAAQQRPKWDVQNLRRLQGWSQLPSRAPSRGASRPQAGSASLADSQPAVVPPHRVVAGPPAAGSSGPSGATIRAHTWGPARILQRHVVEQAEPLATVGCMDDSGNPFETVVSVSRAPRALLLEWQALQQRLQMQADQSTGHSGDAQPHLQPQRAGLQAGLVQINLQQPRAALQPNGWPSPSQSLQEAAPAAAAQGREPAATDSVSLRPHPASSQRRAGRAGNKLGQAWQPVRKGEALRPSLGAAPKRGGARAAAHELRVFQQVARRPAAKLLLSQDATKKVRAIMQRVPLEAPPAADLQSSILQLLQSEDSS